MRAHKFLILTLAAVLSFGLAACGGGGGGGGGNPNPEFRDATILAQPAGATFNAGLAINDDTTVVGTSDGGASPATLQAAAWVVTPATTQPPVPTGSAITLLALPAGNGPYGAAYGINDGEAIVGEMAVTASGLIIPAIWTDRLATAAPLALGATATQGSAYGINTGGRIVGEVIDAGVTMAVTWGSSAALEPVLLSTLTLNPPTTASSAYAVNDAGEIVGELTDAAGTHAVVWRAVAGVYGDPILLPTPTGLTGDKIALAINSAGHIVGELDDTATGFVHAVRWLRGGGTTFTVVDLGPINSDSGAAGINDSGRTVGYVGTLASAWAGGTSTSSVTMNTALTDSKAFAINNLVQAVGVSGGKAFVALR